MVSTLFSIPGKAPAAPISARRGKLGRASSGDSPSGSHDGGYIGGPENALVRCIEQVLAGERPAWNPVVVHGMSGCGKSLLLDLFATEFSATFPGANIVVITGADYARAYANACDNDSMSDFRQRMARAQLLVIDDLHRLAGKDGAEQELIHLLDALTRRGSLVLVATRKPPLDCTFHPMLQSRLSAGLVVPLAAPQQEARREIVAALAQQQKVHLPPAVMQRLADTTALSGLPLVTVPQLRHAVMELARRARSEKSSPHTPGAVHSGIQSVPAAIQESWLDDLSADERPEPRTVMKRVTAAVAKHYQQSVADVRGPTRRQSVVQPRSLAMYLCRQLTSASYAEIGRYFGNRDHTTVLYACRKTTAELAASPPLSKFVEGISASLAAGEG